jgi:hypothetical protein
MIYLAEHRQVYNYVEYFGIGNCVISANWRNQSFYAVLIDGWRVPWAVSVVGFWYWYFGIMGMFQTVTDLDPMNNALCNDLHTFFFAKFDARAGTTRE